MSLIATAAAASAELPTIKFHGHGHRKGGLLESSTNSSSTASTPNPATTQGLFSSLLQSLEQVTGVPVTTLASVLSGTTAASAATPASATTASTATTAPAATSTASASVSPTEKEKVQGFLHQLFLALKADGLGSTAGAAGASTAAGTSTTAAGTAAGVAQAGSYEGSLASSLQTLIQQLGSTGTASAATSNLSASFNSLVAGLGGTATSGASATNSSLQNFLSSLLQNVQTGAAHALSSVGANVNASV